MAPIWFHTICFVTSFSHSWESYVTHTLKIVRNRGLHGNLAVVLKCILWSMVQILCQNFISFVVKCMNSYNIQIHIFYEFNGLNIWIHTNVNLYNIWIHRVFAVQNKWIHLIVINEFIQLLWGWSPNREHVAQTARAKPKPQARSKSRKGKAQVHLLPQPGGAWLPQPLGLHAAAPIVGVACGSPDS